MDIILFPGKLQGKITAIPSKSQAHRMLICAAFADAPTELYCPLVNRDIEATAGCLCSLGAKIERTQEGYSVIPAKSIPSSASLCCYDSGSTLRFLLPVVGALGVDTVFQMTGRLPQRPLSPLWEEMERMGCFLSRPSENTIRCTGRLRAGVYTIGGGISSQFITGLLLAAALMDGESTIQIEGTLESRPYVEMTQKAMALFQVSSRNFHSSGGRRFVTPGKLIVEGDWSNGAFFLAARALGSDLEVTNLDPASPQGDRAAASLLKQLSGHITVHAGDIPDLVPILAIAAAAASGAEFTNIQRLRLKESDRVSSVIEMITALGGKAAGTEDTLTVWGTGLSGGMVDSHNDHRIAMAAAIAATVCSSPVVILGAECVAKSYPQFFEDFARLGGHYEQYIR